jgi:hypothetical protein
VAAFPPEEGGKLDPVEEFIKPIPRPGRAPLTINNLSYDKK